tara:strand:+ start:385 stop:894 length:510 start_codon:yes stop_codon:yes gene_type:complete
MKLFLIKLTYAFLSCVVIIFVVSCSILDYEKGQNKSKYSQNNIKKNKCPLTKIPSKTASYISTKKYILSIKKIEMVCKNELVRSSNVLDIVVQFKVITELKTNKRIKTKNLMLPNIYIALVDRESEAVLAKMISKIDIKNKEDNLIVNEKKIKFKHANNDNLSIYFGLQ